MGRSRVAEPTPVPTPKPTDQAHTEDRVCIICWEGERTSRLPCGHILMCEECATQMKQEQSPPTCPNCRATFMSFTVSKGYTRKPSFTEDDDLALTEGWHVVGAPAIQLSKFPVKKIVRIFTNLLCLLGVGLHIWALVDDSWTIFDDPEFFPCGNNVYIRVHQLNDSYCDCPLGNDEAPGVCFRCFNGLMSVNNSMRNDGRCDCPDGSDEIRSSCALWSEIAVVDESTLASSDYWTNRIDLMTISPPSDFVVQVRMGSVRDYYKLATPIAGASPKIALKHLLTSNNKHVWSQSSKGPFIQPPYLESNDLGGSETFNINASNLDYRTILSFWGSDDQSHTGGCCYSDLYAQDYGWRKPFQLLVTAYPAGPIRQVDVAGLVVTGGLATGATVFADGSEVFGSLPTSFQGGDYVLLDKSQSVRIRLLIQTQATLIVMHPSASLDAWKHLDLDLQSFTVEVRSRSSTQSYYVFVVDVNPGVYEFPSMPQMPCIAAVVSSATPVKLVLEPAAATFSDSVVALPTFVDITLLGKSAQQVTEGQDDFVDLEFVQKQLFNTVPIEKQTCTSTTRASVRAPVDAAAITIGVTSQNGCCAECRSRSTCVAWSIIVATGECKVFSSLSTVVPAAGSVVGWISGNAPTVTTDQNVDFWLATTLPSKQLVATNPTVLNNQIPLDQVRTGALLRLDGTSCVPTSAPTVATVLTWASSVACDSARLAFASANVNSIVGAIVIAPQDSSTFTTAPLPIIVLPAVPSTLASTAQSITITMGTVVAVTNVHGGTWVETSTGGLTWTVPSQSPSPSFAPCSCTSTGFSGGVNISPQVGCGSHDTSLFPFCYVVGTTSQCPQARPSSRFPGAAYIFCDPTALAACDDSKTFSTSRGSCSAYEPNQAAASYCAEDGASQACGLACQSCVPAGGNFLQLDGLPRSVKNYALMGTYVRQTNRIYGSRPYYMLRGDPPNYYLYYYRDRDVQAWVVGQEPGGRFVGLVAYDRAPVPHLITNVWKYFENMWFDSSSLRAIGRDDFEASPTSSPTSTASPSPSISALPSLIPPRLDVGCAFPFPQWTTLDTDCRQNITKSCQEATISPTYCSACPFANAVRPPTTISDSCSSNIALFLARLFSSVTPTPSLSPSNSPTPSSSSAPSRTMVSVLPSPSTTPSNRANQLPAVTFYSRPSCVRGLTRECCPESGLACELCKKTAIVDPPSWCESGLMLKFLLIVAIIIAVFGFFARHMAVVMVCGELMGITCVVLSLVSVLYFALRNKPDGASMGSSFVIQCIGFCVYFIVTLSNLFHFREAMRTGHGRREAATIDSTFGGFELGNR
eukprot:c17017_g1_i1.p1 GENE.c17017_g1_i1~~c17017_g1_i1.p1  ORF type:complete len:1317 (+),score=227.89 c17017_g1_i1:29-3979(+)